MIEGVKLFSDLNGRDETIISELLRKKEFNAGQTVYKEGDPGDLLNCVMHGKLKVCKTTAEGEQYCIVSLTDGEIFGIMSLPRREPSRCHDYRRR